MGHIKIVQSGTTVEIYEYEKELQISTAPRRARKRGSRPVVRRVDNSRGRKTAFIRLVRSNLGTNDPPLLITLTIYQILSLPRAYAEFTKFIRRAKKYFSRCGYSGIRYIAVPEFQERGAVHFHVLLWGLPKEFAEHERNNRTFQILWGLGYVDCVSTDGSPKLAGYLGKYLSKAMSDIRLYGQKAYTSGGRLLRPVSLSSKTQIDFALELWGKSLGVDNSPLQESSYETKWLGRCNYKRIQL